MMSQCSLETAEVQGLDYNGDITEHLPAVLVAPVSGHGLVEQLGIILKLSSLGYRPKTSLGASGGSLAIGLMTAHDWNNESVFAWMNSMNSFDIFRPTLFSYATAFFSQSIYNTGEGLNQIFRKIASGSIHRDNELIITAHNNGTGRLEIFSTVSSKKSVMQNTGPLLLAGSMCKISYLGDISNENEYLKTLEAVFRATSAVPIVFPPVKIGQHYYIDGGVAFSSPLNPFMMIHKVNEIIYIFPEDIDIPNPSNSSTAVGVGQDYLAQVSRSNYIHDRISYLQSICCGNYDQLKVVSGDFDNFVDSVYLTSGKSRMIEIFPYINRSLPIMSNHSKSDIMMRLHEQLNNFRYRIFYLE